MIFVIVVSITVVSDKKYLVALKHKEFILFVRYSWFFLPTGVYIEIIGSQKMWVAIKNDVKTASVWKHIHKLSLKKLLLSGVAIISTNGVNLV